MRDMPDYYSCFIEIACPKTLASLDNAGDIQARDKFSNLHYKNIVYYIISYLYGLHMAQTYVID